MKLLLLYALTINGITFILFGIDKWFAIHNKWRISEQNLLGFSCIGGSVGGLLAMFIFKHKIAKPSFFWRFMGIFLVQLLILFFSKI